MSISLNNKRGLVFTGGGLAPALNPTLYGVVKEARRKKMKIYGGMFGWTSLSKEGKIIDLTRLNIEPIKNVGGTFLRSSRTNPYKIIGGIKQVKDKLKKFKIDFIIAIGGDDTLGAAFKLFKEHGLQIVGIPKTIDNDLSGTYFTPGFPSAAYYLSTFTEEIKKDAAYALSRVFIIEVLGSKAGWIAASGSYGEADVIVPPEKEIKLEKVLEILEKRYKENGNFATLVISEEANLGKKICGFDQDQKDQYEVKRKEFVCLNLKKIIKQELRIGARIILPGNYLQTGLPTEIDKKFAIELGEKSIELIRGEKFGFMACLVRPSLKSNKIIVDKISLDEVVGKENYRKLDNSYFDFEKLKVKQKFLDYMEPILGKYKPKKDEYYKLLSSLPSFIIKQ